MGENQINVPLLDADDIECRIGQAMKKRGGGAAATILLYKDSRADQRMLDAVFGPENWQRTHEEILGELYCNVDVFVGGKWVRKQDVGVESNVEKEKGRASDSFKRASTNWGIGRELYTSPFIYIPLNEDEYTDDAGKIKVNPRTKFFVSEISYNDKRKISHLVLKDDSGTVRFKWDRLGEKKAPAQKQSSELITENDRRQLFHAAREALGEEEGDKFLSAFLARNGKKSTRELTTADAVKFMEEIDSVKKEDK